MLEMKLKKIAEQCISKAGGNTCPIYSSEKSVNHHIISIDANSSTDVAVHYTQDFSLLEVCLIPISTLGLHFVGKHYILYCTLTAQLCCVASP